MNFYLFQMIFRLKITFSFLRLNNPFEINPVIDQLLKHVSNNYKLVNFNIISHFCIFIVINFNILISKFYKLQISPIDVACLFFSSAYILAF